MLEDKIREITNKQTEINNEIYPLCPSCKSKNIKLIEERDDNGVIGPGYVSWVIDSYLSCKDCGTRFDKIKKK